MREYLNVAAYVSHLFCVLASEAPFSTALHMHKGAHSPVSLILLPPCFSLSYTQKHHPVPHKAFSVFYYFIILFIVYFILCSYFIFSAPSRGYSVVAWLCSATLKLCLLPKVCLWNCCSCVMSFNNISYKTTKNSTQWMLWNNVLFVQMQRTYVWK